MPFHVHGKLSEDHPLVYTCTPIEGDQESLRHLASYDLILDRALSTS
jgi:hypothetical protein